MNPARGSRMSAWSSLLRWQHRSCLPRGSRGLPRRFAVACSLMLVFVLAACGRPAAPLADAPLPAPTPAPAVVFPRDAGPHDALTEWWYYTGHLASADGHRYG